MVWVLATAQPLPELEGVQVVSIEAGYGGLVESASTQAAPVAATGSE